MSSFNPYADILAKAAALPDPGKRSNTRKEAEYIKIAKELAAIVQDEVKHYDANAHSDRSPNSNAELFLTIWSQKPAPNTWCGQAWQAGARWAFNHLVKVVDADWVIVPKEPTDAMLATQTGMAPAVTKAVYTSLIKVAPEYKVK